jgi:hypothetical protein
MSPSQTRIYSRNYRQPTPDAADFLETIQKIPVLTKIGALCLIMGKFFGIMAIPAAFIPELNILAIPFIVAWGGFVFIAIVLCSVDHFHHKKLATSDDKLVTITDVPETSPQLLGQLRQQFTKPEEDEPVVIIPLTVGRN